MTAAKLRPSAKEIGRDVAAIGALLEDTEEYRAIVNSTARAIREERKGAVYLTKGEARAVLRAIGLAAGNGRNNCLLRAEAKIRAHISY